MTPESKVKARVKKILQEVGAYYAMPATGGYGLSGTPDFLVCLRGEFIAIECKAKNNKPTTLQERNMAKIRENGGVAIVVNEENLNAVQEMLDQLEGV